MVGRSASDGVVTDPRTIAVVGGGYVGAPTAAMLAHFGHTVIMAERNAPRRQMLSAGESPFLEEGLADLLESTLKSGRLRVTANAVDAVRGARFVFLCVATPPQSSGDADVSDVVAAAEEIRSALEPGAIVINKSTVPVGTVELIASVLGRSDVAVVSNPEFLSEGNALAHSFAPNRTIVGSDDQRAAEAVGELFAPTGAPLLLCAPRTAELIKYAANAFLVTKISFVNSVARLCDALGASIDDVTSALGLDPRIGAAYLRPGPGWGGPCLPKDVSALVSIARVANVDVATIAAAMSDNTTQIHHVAQRALEFAGFDAVSPRIAVFGLSFKAGTSDVRDSPAVAVATELVDAGAEVVAFDPSIEPNEVIELGDLEVVASSIEAASGADVIVVLTEWPEFAALDWVAIKQVVAQATIYDVRGIVDVDQARRAGFTVNVLGRP